MNAINISWLYIHSREYDSAYFKIKIFYLFLFHNWFQARVWRWSAVLTWDPRYYVITVTTAWHLVLSGRRHPLHGDCSGPLDSQQPSAADQPPPAAGHCSAAWGSAGPPGDRQDLGPGQRQLLLPPLLRHPGLGDGAHRHRSGLGKLLEYKCNNSMTVWVMLCNLSPY